MELEESLDPPGGWKNVPHPIIVTEISAAAKKNCNSKKNPAQKKGAGGNCTAATIGSSLLLKSKLLGTVACGKHI
jgi:hypothetical protein